MIALQPGQSFGAFTIINQIAAPGDVAAYKAYDSAHARDVTLMLFASAPPDFAQTTSALRGLSHPHIVPLYESGVQDGIFYVATRDSSSLRPLRERLSDSALDLPSINRIIAQLADALNIVHARGLAHGALTPDSVLLDDGGNVFISPPGLRAFAPRSLAPYASPEQTRGNAPDARDDLFALGAILAAMVTASEFDAAHAALPDALKRLSGALPSQRQSEFVSEAARVIRRALSPERSERFTTADELLAAWQRATAQQQSVAGPPSTASAAATLSAAQRAALGGIAGVTQTAAAQRAESARREAIRGVLRLTQVIAARRERVARARLASELAALREKVSDAAPTVQRAQTWAQQSAVPRTVARRAPRLAMMILVGTLLLCVGVPSVCIGIVALLPDATPTPTAIAQRVPTQAAPTRTAAAPRITQPAPTRTPTRAPTRAPLNTTLVFSDTFSADACRLPNGDDDQRVFRCENGEYTMLSRNGSSHWAQYSDEYTDLVIEVDARVIKAASSLEYGLLWRVSPDGESLYGLTLKPNGETAIFRYQNSTFNYFISGLTLNSVPQNARTRLKVSMQQQRMEFSVNDASFLSISDAALTRGAVGFFIKSGDPSAQVAFSNLRIWQINP